MGPVTFGSAGPRATCCAASLCPHATAEIAHTAAIVAVINATARKIVRTLIEFSVSMLAGSKPPAYLANFACLFLTSLLAKDFSARRQVVLRDGPFWRQIRVAGKYPLHHLAFERQRCIRVPRDAADKFGKRRDGCRTDTSKSPPRSHAGADHILRDQRTASSLRLFEVDCAHFRREL